MCAYVYLCVSYMHGCITVKTYMCVYVYTCIRVYCACICVRVYCVYSMCVYTWRSIYQYTHIGVELVHGLVQVHYVNIYMYTCILRVCIYTHVHVHPNKLHCYIQPTPLHDTPTPATLQPSDQPSPLHSYIPTLQTPPHPTYLPYP